MESLALFLTQFLWFFAASSAMVYFVVWPWSLQLSEDRQLSFWIAPQMFRAFGLGLLVPNLSPGIPQAFAIPTAAVDFFTALLALLAFVGLQRGWQLARQLTWACTLIGLSDLLIAFSIAPFIGVTDHLTAQWYIPAFVGPLMIVAHVGCLAALLKRIEIISHSFPAKRLPPSRLRQGASAPRQVLTKEGDSRTILHIIKSEKGRAL